MKKKIIIYLFIIISITFIYAQTEDQAKIYVVNLFSDTADIRLGEESDYVFQVLELEAYTATAMNLTSAQGSYTLYFKLSSEDEWFPWGDEDYIYECPVKAGSIHCIMINTQGQFEYYTLTQEAMTGVNVCFFNNTGKVISRMQVSMEWADPLAYALDLADQDMTNFVGIDPGYYSMYWQFSDQKDTNNYYYYPDQNGEEEILAFQANGYYMFILLNAYGEDHALLLDITP